MSSLVRTLTRRCMCVRGFFSTQAGFRTHDVNLRLLTPGWNIVSFRALDGLNSFNLIYIFYGSPISQSPRDFSPQTLAFIASADASAAAACAPSPQPPSAASASPSSPSPQHTSAIVSAVEEHCVFRCPAAAGGDVGGEGRTLLAMTARNGWAHTQVLLLFVHYHRLHPMRQARWNSHFFYLCLQVALAALHRNTDVFDLLVVSDGSDDV